MNEDLDKVNEDLDKVNEDLDKVITFTGNGLNFSQFSVNS